MLVIHWKSYSCNAFMDAWMQDSRAVKYFHITVIDSWNCMYGWAESDVIITVLGMLLWHIISLVFRVTPVILPYHEDVLFLWAFAQNYCVLIWTPFVHFFYFVLSHFDNDLMHSFSIPLSVKIEWPHILLSRSPFILISLFRYSMPQVWFHCVVDVHVG